ncbi:Lrp/AsnC family transcriptional regulator [Aureisphaera galaxeae]|uniref:Lrp/AsnC family transcriptional regulator n=1 Tax=Aureisphaera galaxeae TaxID=1538023 RepID=UPI00235035FA|nr:Lrp/AsnC family transcriptional regulator [Aureisphaera galaxeae]MDC8004778.1 Lrp/AsnC family transcriptional regulator [Aureisphaera galaxeae]
MVLDRIDRRLLRYLQQDCKQTNKELSHKLDLSVTAVYERIKKLERTGIIKGYEAHINKDAVGLGFLAFCHIRLEKHAKETIGSFEKEVRKLNEVLECFHVSGEYDYLLKVVVKDMEHFRNFMVNKLTTIEHIGSTQSSFTINEVKNTTQLTLSDDAS